MLLLNKNDIKSDNVFFFFFLDPEALKEMSQSQADAQKMMSDMPSLSDMFSNARNQQQQQQQRR